VKEKKGGGRRHKKVRKTSPIFARGKGEELQMIGTRLPKKNFLRQRRYIKKKTEHEGGGGKTKQGGKKLGCDQ